MKTAAANLAAWNEAHSRLRHYLNTFALADEVWLERVALRLLDEARALHAADPSIDPVTITLRHAQAELARWLGVTLTGTNGGPSPQTLTSGTIALLLNRRVREQPAAFLGGEMPLEMREALRRTLVVTGPDLTVSSMTPRHLDYGPLLDLARQTWHRYDARSFLTAVVFWLGIYGVCSWFLAEYL